LTNVAQASWETILELLTLLLVRCDRLVNP